MDHSTGRMQRPSAAPLDASAWKGAWLLRRLLTTLHSLFTTQELQRGGCDACEEASMASSCSSYVRASSEDHGQSITSIHSHKTPFGRIPIGRTQINIIIISALKETRRKSQGMKTT